MKDSLLISFDYHKNNESTISFAVANLLGYIKFNLNDKNVLVDSFSFNMNDSETIFTRQYKNLIEHYELDRYEIIAISLYCWNKQYVNELIDALKSINSKALIVLGGYEVNLLNENQMTKDYPQCDKFIAGYAEESLLSLIKVDLIEDKIVHREFDINKSPMLYSTNLIKNTEKQKIRIESKRGCVYRCTFCAHRDIIEDKLLEHSVDEVIDELKYLNSLEIGKVNFVDPIFNFGMNYMEILEAMVEMNFKHLVSFQVRFESIKGVEKEKFILLASKLNCILEFGLQTTNYEESKIIKRHNNLNHVKEIIEILNKKKIKYLVSLIYGLPKQTLDSFKESIKFLQENDCKNIECYPLMLLNGTNLYYEKDNYGLIEKNINGIDNVIRSDSFSESEYLEMEFLANSLRKQL